MRIERCYTTIRFVCDVEIRVFCEISFEIV